jgi:hypothetical protein
MAVFTRIFVQSAYQRSLWPKSSIMIRQILRAKSARLLTSHGRACIELVASFADRSNLLKEWEKTDTCAVSAYGAHGLKNAAITRIPDHALLRSPTHFSDRTALVCRGCLPPWPMREAPALRKTRNQFRGSVRVSDVACLKRFPPKVRGAPPARGAGRRWLGRLVA